MDIEIEDDETPSEQLPRKEAEQSVMAETSFAEAEDNVFERSEPEDGANEKQTSESPPLSGPSTSQLEKHGSKLATPAIRYLTRQLNVQLEDIPGTGNDGRVLKEDVYRFLESADQGAISIATTQPEPLSPTNTLDTPDSKPLSAARDNESYQEEHHLPLTNIQAQMFKMMTKSLAIPHFLYTDEYKLDALESLRARLNRNIAQTLSPSSQSPSFSSSLVSSSSSSETTPMLSKKLTYLPFIIKATSLALKDYPILNARLDSSPSSFPLTSQSQSPSPTTQTPRLVLRQHHNIGIATSTPQGLVVPVIKEDGKDEDGDA